MARNGVCNATRFRRTIINMTASPPPTDPPLVRALREVREILERARRTGDRREIETAIERINFELDKPVIPKRN